MPLVVGGGRNRRVKTIGNTLDLVTDADGTNAVDEVDVSMWHQDPSVGTRFLQGTYDPLTTTATFLSETYTTQFGT